MAAIRHPLLGDIVYGTQKQPYGLTGQLLHASALSFRHPNGEYMTFNTPPPEIFNEIIKKLQ
jgi:23S rRNA pseudouridine1911/1915/1917 synthase